jgi:hypothetical protein
MQQSMEVLLVSRAKEDHFPCLTAWLNEEYPEDEATTPTLKPLNHALADKKEYSEEVERTAKGQC